MVTPGVSDGTTHDLPRCSKHFHFHHSPLERNFPPPSQCPKQVFIKYDQIISMDSFFVGVRPETRTVPKSSRTCRIDPQIHQSSISLSNPWRPWRSFFLRLSIDASGPEWMPSPGALRATRGAPRTRKTRGGESGTRRKDRQSQEDSSCYCIHHTITDLSIIPPPYNIALNLSQKQIGHPLCRCGSNTVRVPVLRSRAGCSDETTQRPVTACFFFSQHDSAERLRG